MDTDHIAALLRGLRTTPSRRAVTTSVAALAASTVLAPYFGKERAEGKGKKKKKRKKNPKDLVPPPCALGQIACHDDSFACCDPKLCTSCGCCPATRPSCCGDATTVNRLCYDPTAESCCPTSTTGLVGACRKQTFCAFGAGGLVPICCPSGVERCVFGCCQPGEFCCPDLMMCCVDSSCDESKGACFNIAGGELARMG